MARPRKNKVTTPNLYCRLDRKINKVYWQYKNPVNGKFYGLGTDEDEAIAVANEANARFASVHAKQLEASIIKSRIDAISTHGISLNLFIDKYMEYNKSKVASGQIKASTLIQMQYRIEAIRKSLGSKSLPNITVADCNDFISSYTREGKNRMAKIMRSSLSDIFKVAQHMGEVDAGFNPAIATISPYAKVRRSRLTLDEFIKILDAANKEKTIHWMYHAMRIGLATGQRIGDILAMKYTDIINGRLHITQQKTGSKLAISLNLYNEALKSTLGDIIDETRDSFNSEYIIHRMASHGVNRAGTRIKLTSSASRIFADLRDSCNIDWGENTPASFHEIRSLSERLYRDQGIDTQKLLGHRSKTMTDQYNNSRGKEYTIIE